MFAQLTQEFLEEFGELNEPRFLNLREPGRFLIYGESYNHDMLMWERIGEPNDWHVVVAKWDREYEEYSDESMTSYFEGVASGRIVSTMFPENVGKPPLEFLQ